MEIRKKVLGEEDPDTLTSMKNLVFTLESQSRKEEAIALMKTCFKLQKHILAQRIQTRKHRSKLYVSGRI